MARITFGHRQRLALGAAALLAAGAAGGAGAVALTRPSVEMAPTIATPIARLPASGGIVTVKGRVAEVFGDRFVVQDGSGRAMIDAGRNGADGIARGSAVLVQGRYDDGQLRAHFLVGPSGQVEQVGPKHPPHGPHGPGKDGPGKDGPGKDGPGKDGPGRDGPDRDGPGRDGPGRDGPRAGPEGRDAPPPPPPAATTPVPAAAPTGTTTR